MKKGRSWTLLGIPLIRTTTTEKNYKNSILRQYKIILLRTFLLSVGYSSFEGDSILIQIGITKLELFTSFTIKNRWFR